MFHKGLVTVQCGVCGDDGNKRGSRVFISGGGGGQWIPRKLWGGGFGKRAQLTGPLVSLGRIGLSTEPFWGEGGV